MRLEVPQAVQPEETPQDALRHADALFHLARHLTGSAADAEDLVQETYARAFQAWDRLQPGSNVKAWLFRILRNAFLSDRRHAARGPAASRTAGVSVDPVADAVADPFASDGWLRGDLELDQLRRRVATEIEAALATLSEEGRTIILLDVEGCTETEIADVMGCPVGTVKSRLSRSRAALRTQLAAYGREVEP